MRDTLNKWLDDYKQQVNDPTELQLFQAGVSKNAQSFRERAVAVIQKTKLKDDVKNELLTGIGSLSDIPE